MHILFPDFTTSHFISFPVISRVYFLLLGGRGGGEREGGAGGEAGGGRAKGTLCSFITWLLATAVWCSFSFCSKVILRTVPYTIMRHTWYGRAYLVQYVPTDRIPTLYYTWQERPYLLHLKYRLSAVQELPRHVTSSLECYSSGFDPRARHALFINLWRRKGTLNRKRWRASEQDLTGVCRRMSANVGDDS